MIYDAIYTRPDGSFVINKNGLPYHVPDSDGYEEEWRQVKAFADTHPECVHPESEMFVQEEENAETRMKRLRLRRNRRLAATDYLVMPDYPLTDEQRERVAEYRQALRDLPEKDGAPWDGGENATPWPELAEI